MGGDCKGRGDGSPEVFSVWYLEQVGRLDFKVQGK